MLRKKYTCHATPIIVSEKKAQELVMRQYFIFHLILGMVFFFLAMLLSVFYIHPSEDFISSPFFSFSSAEISIEERATCENVFYLIFFCEFSSSLFECKITVSSKKADADVAAKLLLKVNICFTHLRDGFEIFKKIMAEL